MTLFLMYMQAIPVVLGPTGTILFAVITLTLAALNAYQWYRSSEAKHWQGASTAYKEELEIVRQRCERLESENKEFLSINAKLLARTDLSVLDMKLNDASKENQEVHELIVANLKQLIDKSDQRYARVTEVLEGHTTAIHSLGNRMTHEFELHREFFADMTKTLRAMRPNVIEDIG
jgi:predicted negative regulator of RcsB-dependent stress response